MTNQPYDQPYEGYGAPDPYGHQAATPPQAAWPGQQAYDEPHPAEQTQQWQGQTWETQLQPPVPAEETAYLPPLGHQEPPGTGYGAEAYQPQQPHQPQIPGHEQQARSPQQPQGHQGYPPYQAYGAYEPQPQPHPYPGRPGDQAYPAAAQGHQAQQPQGYPAGAHQGQAHPPQDYAAQGYAAPDHAAHDRPAPGPHAAAAAPPAEAGPAGTEPGYGPATLAGNARITDAQRARAEGRSPIIEPGMQPAALTALLGLLLAAAAAAGTYALLLPLVVLQAVTAAGWFRLNGMWPARQGIALGFLGALVADAALLVADGSPAAILGTLGVWVLLALVLQLRSHADPDERMYGLMATVAASALAIVAGGYLAADADAVTVGAAAVAVAAVARALPLPTPVSVVASLLAAAGAGIAVGQMTGIGTPGALLGAGAAVCALVGHRAASYDYPSRFVHFTAGVALPLAAAAPAVYLLGRAVG
ncbi:membrane protein [Streptomyces cyaneogriseus subsp. noncyanogenus]|uniref:Membrane protein n=1 Tax=Streptomyces cyaneogriseus subsp. noncyanogenus TaxID=477245 RepID=A0A0C5GFA8_9ACTN|nr:hypothetical protein [Streptomyces cyaneogriseus]AJP03061.1 membrane protein [Streptomyces cyaneogriseus subsp. noncyanogenus]